MELRSQYCAYSPTTGTGRLVRRVQIEILNPELRKLNLKLLSPGYFARTVSSGVVSGQWQLKQEGSRDA